MEKSEKSPPYAEVDLSAGHDNEITTRKIGAEALVATEIEHQMTFLQGLKLYPKSIGWSAFFSLGVIMTAFDPQLLGSLYATPAFQRDFGYLFEGEYIVSAPWQYVFFDVGFQRGFGLGIH